jgi:hypothetical protein
MRVGKGDWIMNGLLRAACLGTAAIALVWLPRAALALDVVAVKSVIVKDAKSAPGGKLTVGRELEISCHYGYSGSFASAPKKLPGWKVRLEVDGKTIASVDATIPGNYLASYTFTAAGNWTAAAAGNHVARCVLDPDSKLASLESEYDRKNNIQQRQFVVDVAPVFEPGAGMTKGSAAPTPAGALPAPGKGKSAQAPGTAAQGAAPVVLNPDLRLSLRAQVLSNCGKGQDVVNVSGRLSNAGSGHALIPAGKPIVKIEAPAGVYGGTITTGNLAPGQSQQISLMLKPKAMPESLAGAKLTLKASIIQGVIKEASYAGNEQDLTVVFPASYCKQGKTTSGAATDLQRAAPKRQ